MDTNEFNKLFNIIIKRAKTGKRNSYTKKLLTKGAKKIAQKVGEESAELIIDYLKGSKKSLWLAWLLRFRWFSGRKRSQPDIRFMR